MKTGGLAPGTKLRLAYIPRRRRKPKRTHHISINIVGIAAVYATFLEDVTVPLPC